MDLFEPWRNAPPARHTLESDSEEEQDPEDIYRSGSSTSTRFQKSAPVVEVQWTGERPSAKEQDLIIANGEAGMAWSQGLDTSSLSLDGFLSVDGQKAASLTCFSNPKPTVIAFISASLTYQAMHTVAERLVEECQPSNVTIIESYSYSSYLSPTASKPTIRYLATDSRPNLKLQRFEPPNLVQGLTAALACEADERDIPCLIVLLPSNLSDSTSASVIVHATHRQPVPESVYDYGGPLPGSENLLDGGDTRSVLSQLSTSLGWNNLGWHVPEFSSRVQNKRLASGPTNQAGFGWWEESKRAHRQAISDGGMYT